MDNFDFIIKNIFKEQKKISKDYDYFTLSELELKREGTTYTSQTLA